MLFTKSHGTLQVTYFLGFMCQSNKYQEMNALGTLELLGVLIVCI